MYNKTKKYISNKWPTNLVCAENKNMKINTFRFSTLGDSLKVIKKYEIKNKVKAAKISSYLNISWMKRKPFLPPSNPKLSKIPIVKKRNAKFL